MTPWGPLRVQDCQESSLWALTPSSQLLIVGEGGRMWLWQPGSPPHSHYQGRQKLLSPKNCLKNPWGRALTWLGLHTHHQYKVLWTEWEKLWFAEPTLHSRGQIYSQMTMRIQKATSIWRTLYVFGKSTGVHYCLPDTTSVTSAPFCPSSLTHKFRGLLPDSTSFLPQKGVPWVPAFKTGHPLIIPN